MNNIKMIVDKSVLPMQILFSWISA